MSSYTSYSIDETTRFLIEDKDGNERVITDLGGNHDLTRTYIRLALQIWKPEQIGFSDLIEKHKPNKIKIDVEGAEYDFLPFTFPNFVERLVMEIHFQYDPSWRQKGFRVHQSMLQQGFSPQKKFVDTGKNWHVIGAYVR